MWQSNSPVLVLGRELVPNLFDDIPLYVVLMDSVLAHTYRHPAMRLDGSERRSYEAMYFCELKSND